MERHDLAQRLGHRARVALDDEVDLARRHAEQRVAHRAADDPAPRGPLEHLQRASPQRSARRASGRPGSDHAILTREAAWYHLWAMSRPSGGRRRGGVGGFGAPVLRPGRRRRGRAETGRQGDVSNPDVAFEDSGECPGRPVPPSLRWRSDPARHPFDDGFSWPFYGNAKRARATCPCGPPATAVPSRRGRDRPGAPRVHAGALRPLLFLLKNNGALYAMRA